MFFVLLVNLSTGLDSLDIAYCRLRGTSNCICWSFLLLLFLVVVEGLLLEEDRNGEEPDEVNVGGESM